MGIRETILDRAVEAVASGGESALRVHDIARHVGCSVSALYVHFGSREGLAEAALIERFKRVQAERPEPLAQRVASATTVPAVRKALSAHVDQLCSEEHGVVHLARTELVAAARTRPTVRDALMEFEARRHAELSESLKTVKGRGLVRKDLDVDATATLLRSISLTHAMVLTDGNGGGRQWPRVLCRSLEAVILP